ncbi:MAG: RtcB family protein [Erysipelotrichaceae bacterium]
MLRIKGKYNEAILFTEELESTAADQIGLLCNQEWCKDSVIRIMPDVHAGKGCTIGTTMTLQSKVCPNLVGVDLGCGMLTVSLGDISLDLEKLDAFIRASIPSGFNVHETPVAAFPGLNELRCLPSLKEIPWILNSIGTLGGGNHFLEVDKDESGKKYLIIHTGSRNLGKQVAEYYQNLAIKGVETEEYKTRADELIKHYKEIGKQKQINKELNKLKEKLKHNLKIPRELCFLEGTYMDDYLHDISICQQYASLNRETIASIIMNYLKIKEFDMFHTIHNYIDVDSMILRKGAISAKKGQKLLIPLNMRDGCILGIGKGNPDYNYSAPHGAGRTKSRQAAKKTLDLDTFKKEMSGIYSSSVCENTLDESPMAYKPASSILENIHDSVEVIEVIKPIYNFKATD